MLRHFTLEYWVDYSWYVGKLREVRKRAFGTNQQMGQVVIAIRLEHVEVIALNMPQYRRPTLRYFPGLAFDDGLDTLDQRAIGRRRIIGLTHRAEPERVSAGQPGVNGGYVVNHIAIAD